MSFSSIVAITISLANPIVSRVGFSTPLFLSGEAAGIFPSSVVVRTYTDPNDLLTDGFEASNITYRAAATYFSQPENSGQIKIGKRNLSVGNVFEGTFTFGDGSEGETYWIEIDGTRYTYTLAAAEDEADGAVAVAALIDAEADFIATVAVNAIDFSVVAGDVFPKITMSSNVTWLDTTISTGATTVTDLAAVNEYDPDWYALSTDVSSKGEIEKVRAWIETIQKMYAATTADTETYVTAYSAGVTTDVGSVGKVAGYANTFVQYSDVIGSPDVMGMLALLINEPGSVNWAHRDLRGVAITTKLSEAQLDNLTSKGINWYANALGSSRTFSGITGSSEFIDTINLVHFLYARIPEDVGAALKANKKIPFTQKGLDLLAEVIKARLMSKIGTGISDEVLPFCTAPRISSFSPADRQARRALGFKFGAVLDGAINSVGISGTLSIDPSAFA